MRPAWAKAQQGSHPTWVAFWLGVGGTFPNLSHELGG